MMCSFMVNWGRTGCAWLAGKGRSRQEKAQLVRKYFQLADQIASIGTDSSAEAEAQRRWLTTQMQQLRESEARMLRGARTGNERGAG